MKSSILILTLLLASFVSCIGKATDKQPAESSAKYETYHNERYNYIVSYPDFLLPQGESDNGDGQKFLSKDKSIQLLVYRDYKINFLSEEGALYTLQEAYANDLSAKEKVLNSKMESNSYTINYKQDEKIHTLYSHKTDDDYINILFSYSEQEEGKLKEVIEYVINSLAFEDLKSQEGNNISAGGLEDMFPAFVERFLADCYWGKNINALLRDNDETLAKYIDSEMDVRRYYAPGTALLIADRANNFSFTEYDDFSATVEVGANEKVDVITTNLSICELDFEGNQKVYYEKIEELPSVVVNSETFETASVETLYPKAEMMAVYVPNKYGNPFGLYFINTPNGWKLAFVDDSLCSA